MRCGFGDTPLKRLLSTASLLIACASASTPVAYAQNLEAPQPSRNVHLSDQARQQVQDEKLQDAEPMESLGAIIPDRNTIPNDHWDDERKPAERGASTQTPEHSKVAPLQGGVESDVENFGPAGNAALQAEMARDILRRAPDVSYPETKSVTPAMFKNWLTRTQANLPAENKDSIVVVKGQWDDSAHILHYFGWLFTRLSTNALPKTDLQKASVMIVDCAGDLNQEGLAAVRRFVWNGGYLVTTDWSLDNCLARAIPGALEWNGGYSYPELVDAVIVQPDSELIKGCIGVARWKLDDKSELVRVRTPRFVNVLVRSRMLSRLDPDQAGILAATFQFGKGHVLHVVGHFDNNTTNAFQNQLPDPAPVMGISMRQGIIANFIVAGLKARAVDSAPDTADTKDGVQK